MFYLKNNEKSRKISLSEPQRERNRNDSSGRSGVLNEILRSLVIFLLFLLRRIASRYFSPAFIGSLSISRRDILDRRQNPSEIEHPRHGIPHTRHSGHSPAPCRPHSTWSATTEADCSFHVTAEMIEIRERGWEGDDRGSGKLDLALLSRSRHLPGLHSRYASRSR